MTRMPTRDWFFFFFNDTATPEIYTLSLHDALPISRGGVAEAADLAQERGRRRHAPRINDDLFGTCRSRRFHEEPEGKARSEEHTSELQSHSDLVCRLLLEKKKKKKK